VPREARVFKRFRFDFVFAAAMALSFVAFLALRELREQARQARRAVQKEYRKAA
jgi:hypothetical protein